MNKFIEAIKNFFKRIGKNKLNEGQENQTEKRIKEEKPDMKETLLFDNLDPENYITEDFIMNMLEKLGLNENFRKNPAAKTQLTEFCKKILDSENIDITLIKKGEVEKALKILKEKTSINDKEITFLESEITEEEVQHSYTTFEIFSFENGEKNRFNGENKFRKRIQEISYHKKDAKQENFPAKYVSTTKGYNDFGIQDVEDIINANEVIFKDESQVLSALQIKDGLISQSFHGVNLDRFIKNGLNFEGEIFKTTICRNHDLISARSRKERTILESGIQTVYDLYEGIYLTFKLEDLEKLDIPENINPEDHKKIMDFLYGKSSEEETILYMQEIMSKIAGLSPEMKQRFLDSMEKGNYIKGNYITNDEQKVDLTQDKE